MGDCIPSTSLLWDEEFICNSNDAEASTSKDNGQDELDIRECQHKNVACLMKRKGVTHDDIRASTSRCPKPSWCKNPSRSLETSSHEYEWDSFSKPSTMDIEVDVIHTYSFQPNVVNKSHIGLDRLESHIALVDHIGPSTINLDLYSF